MLVGPLLIRKIPTFGLDYDPIEIVIYIKMTFILMLGVSGKVSIEKYFYIISIAIATFLASIILNNDAFKVIFELLYIAIVACYMGLTTKKISGFENLYIIFLILMITLMIFRLDFSSPGSGPGIYYLWGPTTAVRGYAFLMFVGFYFIFKKNNTKTYPLYVLGTVLFAYANLIAVSKASWIALACIIPLYFFGIKLTKKYLILIAIVISTAALSMFTGAGNLVVSRFEQAFDFSSYYNKINNLSTNSNIEVKPNVNSNNPKNLELKGVESSSEIKLNQVDKTGRVSMYEESIQLILSNPLFGYTFQKTGSNIIFFDKSNGHPHNILLELILRFGAPVSMLLLYVNFKKALTLAANINPKYMYLYISIILYYTMLSMTGGDVVDNVYGYVLLSLFLNTNKEARKC